MMITSVVQLGFLIGLVGAVPTASRQQTTPPAIGTVTPGSPTPVPELPIYCYPVRCPHDGSPLPGIALPPCRCVAPPIPTPTPIPLPTPCHPVACPHDGSPIPGASFPPCPCAKPTETPKPTSSPTPTPVPLPTPCHPIVCPLGGSDPIAAPDSPFPAVNPPCPCPKSAACKSSFCLVNEALAESFLQSWYARGKAVSLYPEQQVVIEPPYECRPIVGFTPPGHE